MPKIALELTYEKILEAATKLNEEDKERLFFSLNKDYAKALDEMRIEARKNHQRCESIRLKDLKWNTKSFWRQEQLSHAGVQYRAAYDIDKKGKVVLVAFLGSRENFYTELRRFIRY